MLGQQWRKREASSAEAAQHEEARGALIRRPGQGQPVGGGDADRGATIKEDVGQALGQTAADAAKEYSLDRFAGRIGQLLHAPCQGVADVQAAQAS